MYICAVCANTKQYRELAPDITRISTYHTYAVIGARCRTLSVQLARISGEIQCTLMPGVKCELTSNGNTLFSAQRPITSSIKTQQHLCMSEMSSCVSVTSVFAECAKHLVCPFSFVSFTSFCLLAPLFCASVLCFLCPLCPLCP